ncbi:MAG: hypothetical protein KF812_07305 [Fimbriimonadaceae bacterium]|nr:hypothetical protein [Fimbriimonadaceae bacterium]
MNPRLQVGAEYNAAAGEWSPTANLIALTETEGRPLVTFGTSSDRIFSPAGNQAYFVTVAKKIPGTAFGPYVGASYSEWEQTVIFPFGVNVALAPEWDALYLNDGRNSHALLTYKGVGWNITLMSVRLRRFGVSVGYAF